ncbi:Arabinanase/levansucrase/invertase [Citrus sinensis]|uniref:Arabinanase/levansucrase/invertase n=2 Tax=Citrus sinensis TaxID=2711 RepID=A0ACB8LLT9_CITSI|nr:Arabinanase/levansucrase/invertase [Citrus sinensis]
MSFMKGDLLMKTRKLVKGMAKAEPVWLKAMEQAPPATFPRAEGKVQKISLPEDVYIKKFFQKHPESLYHDDIQPLWSYVVALSEGAQRINGFKPVPARLFAQRVLEFKEQGVNEEEAMQVADMEYRAEKKMKKNAYSRLKEIAHLLGKSPPPNPYPSAIKKIQAKERKYVRDRFYNPSIVKMVQVMKEERAAEAQDRMRGGGCFVGLQQFEQQSGIQSFRSSPAMEATTAASGMMTAINFLATSPTPRTFLPTTSLSSRWLSKPKKPNLLAVSAPRVNNLLSFLTHCSTKPDTNTNNETDQDSTIEHNSNSNSKSNQSNAPSSSNSDEALGASLSPSNSSSSRGLVLDLGSTNSWDSGEIGSPVVKRFLGDDEERWYMWYHGNSGENPGSDSVGLAISSNGIHWERGNGPVRTSNDVGLVMNCGKDWWAFDTLSIRPSEVAIMSSNKVRASSAVYWLYYTGYSSEKMNFLDYDSLEFNLENPERFHVGNLLNGENGLKRKINKSLPGLAISQDGRHWARIEGEHHSGALFDVGSDEDWDSLFIAAPQVVFHGNGDLRMYYHSFDVEKGEFGIGIARSRDGIKWVKLGKIMGGGIRGSFDEFGVKNACVARNKKDGKYLMAYEGVGADGSSSIGLAVSTGGLKGWRRFQDNNVLKAEVEAEDGWDNKGIGSPYLVQMDGDSDEWRLYYRGIGNGGRTGIGLAVSEGSDVRKFTRWTGFSV